MNEKEVVMTAEQIWEDMFSTKKWVGPNGKYFKQDWIAIPLSFKGRVKAIEIIIDLLKSGNIVKTGYKGSAIRGVREYYIFYKSQKTTTMKTFKKGDAVYYHSNEGDTVPATVLKAGKKRILIHGDFLEGERNTWVSPSNLEVQK